MSHVSLSVCPLRRSCTRLRKTPPLVLEAAADTALPRGSEPWACRDPRCAEVFGGSAAPVTLLAEVATTTGAEGGANGASAVSPSAGSPV